MDHPFHSHVAGAQVIRWSHPGRGTALPESAAGAALGLWGPGTPCVPPGQAAPATFGPGTQADLGVCFRDAQGL